MDDAAHQLDAYVRAALALQGFRFDESRIREIVLQFTRIETVARAVESVPLGFDGNGAAVYRP